MFQWLKDIFAKKESSKIPETSIEEMIDNIVHNNLLRFKNLVNFNSNSFYWASVVKAICMAESGMNPYETYYEKYLADVNGNDPVTEMRYLSEGLMQLSYSDTIIYHCEFDVEIDRHKDEHDKTKSIFDIEKNIICGLQILDKMIENHDEFVFNSGNYWSTLMPRNKRHKEFLTAFNKYYLNK